MNIRLSTVYDACCHHSFDDVANRYSLDEKEVRRIYHRVKDALSDGVPMPMHIAQLSLPLSTYDCLVRNRILSFYDLRDILFDAQRWDLLNDMGKARRNHCIQALVSIGALTEDEYKKLAPVYEFLDENGFEQVKSAWAGVCAVCGKEGDLVQDHWIPRDHKLFPGSGTDNIIPLCIKCNSSKNNGDPFMWVIGKLGHEKGLQKISEIVNYLLRGIDD